MDNDKPVQNLLGDAPTLLEGSATMKEPAYDPGAVSRGDTCLRHADVTAALAMLTAQSEAHEKRGDRVERDITEVKSDVKEVYRVLREYITNSQTQPVKTEGNGVTKIMVYTLIAVSVGASLASGVAVMKVLTALPK